MDRTPRAAVAAVKTSAKQQLIVPPPQPAPPAAALTPTPTLAGGGLPEPHAWAQAHWGAVALGDRRLNARAVELGARMAARPEGRCRSKWARGRSWWGPTGC